MSELLFSAVFGSLRCRSFTLFTEDRSLRSLKILESLQALAPIYRALARSKFYRPQGRSNLITPPLGSNPFRYRIAVRHP